MHLVTLADVQAAVVRIDGIATRTSLVPFGHRLWLKAENLQRVGAFKIRGATNAVAALAPEAAITHSSGNHGAALAYAAREHRIPAIVVMPDVSPQVKIDAVAALGAEIVIVPPAQRSAAARRLAAERGATLVPPYDHPLVIAGQGTVAIEILSDLSDVDTIVVPVGGGGLISGIATAAKALRPNVRIIGVEPELAAETRESLKRGELTHWPTEQTYRTIADGVRTAPSELTFAHIRQYVDDIITVTEEEILDTVRTLALGAKLVAEPSGAVAPAACLHRPDLLPRGRTVAIVSGGNIEPAMLQRCLTVG